MRVSLEFFNTDLLINRLEVSDHVVEDLDYNFDAYQPANGSYWDDTFVMRIDDPAIGANGSYAHIALCGDRLDQDT